MLHEPRWTWSWWRSTSASERVNGERSRSVQRLGTRESLLAWTGLQEVRRWIWAGSEMSQNFAVVYFTRILYLRTPYRSSLLPSLLCGLRPAVRSTFSEAEATLALLRTT